jgi:tetratricopeptide (TPR) repeat protein
VQAYYAGVEELTRHIDQAPTPTPARISLFTTLGDLNLRVGRVDAAARALAAAEALREQVGSVPEWDDVAIERTRGELAIRRGDNEAAIAAAHEVLATPISLWGRARMYSQLGIALLGAWNLDGAWDAFLKEYEAYTDLGGPVNAASSAGNLAEVALRRGDERAAAHYQRIALDLALQLGTPLMLGFSLIVAARIVAARGDWATAATLHRQADLILESTGLILYEDDQRLSDEMLKQAREALGPDGYAAAVASAEPLDVPAAAALADDVLSAAEAGERGS